MSLYQYEPDHTDIIFSHLSARNLGDFTSQLLISAAIKEYFGSYKLGIFYIQDRAYKEPILSLYPGINFTLVGLPGARLPVNIFDDHVGRMKLNNPRLEAFGLNRSRIILSGNSLPNMCLPSFDYVPRLRIPERTRVDTESKLHELGLDSDRWFACFYWREPGYLQRSRQPLRDIVDPSPYIEAMRYVVNDLGGQVVRLGHPTSTALPDHPDIIDLANIEDSLMTQIVAISRARYFVSSSSGPLTFGPGFGVPTAATDAIDISSIWNDDDILLTQRIIDPDGKTLQQMSALTAGLLKSGVGKELGKPGGGYRYIWNTAAELRYVTELLHARTDGQKRWREEEYRVPPTPRTQLPFPLSPSLKTQALVDIPSALHG